MSWLRNSMKNTVKPNSSLLKASPVQSSLNTSTASSLSPDLWTASCTKRPMRSVDGMCAVHSSRMSAPWFVLISVSETTAVFSMRFALHVETACNLTKTGIGTCCVQPAAINRTVHLPTITAQGGLNLTRAPALSTTQESVGVLLLKPCLPKVPLDGRRSLPPTCGKTDENAPTSDSKAKAAAVAAALPVQPQAPDCSSVAFHGTLAQKNSEPCSRLTAT